MVGGFQLSITSSYYIFFSLYNICLSTVEVKIIFITTVTESVENVQLLVP